MKNKLNIKKYISLIIVFIVSILFVNAQLQFSSLDSLLTYAEKNSIVFKTGSQQTLLAKWTKITALANTVNFKSPFNFTMTDNTQLAVNFLPAEPFGGKPGAVKEVTLGQQYITNYGLTPQIDIINPATWAKVKSAELNKQLTEVNNLLSKKSLYESIAAGYYNVVSLQTQKILLKQNLNISDSILLIATRKFNSGIIREQDLNNAKINQLLLQDKLAQLEGSYQQQINSLKILCDMPISSSIIISEKLEKENLDLIQLNTNSILTERQTQIQSQFLKSEMKSNNLAFAPTVSVIFNQGWQQNSNEKFFDNASRWIPTQYIGLKISAPLPDALRLSQSYTSKINWRISELNASHAALQNKINNEQISIDYNKSTSTYSTSKNILNLKIINYQKSYNQYVQGILSNELFLSSFSDKVNAELNAVASLSNLKFNQTKISLNNKIK